MYQCVYLSIRCLNFDFGARVCLVYSNTNFSATVSYKNGSMYTTTVTSTVVPSGWRGEGDATHREKHRTVVDRALYLSAVSRLSSSLPEAYGHV